MARFGLLAVGGGGRAPPADAAVTRAAAAAGEWWHRASFGHWRPEPVLLPPVILDSDPVGWCASGGMGPGPRNTAALARAALQALPPGIACPEAVVLVVAGPVAPHAWRVAGGGVATVPGGWVRRYAALPGSANTQLDVWAHELAHLLLGWPDLPGSPGLMGAGAARDGERCPAAPEPALALAAGWLRLLPADATLAAGALAADAAMILDWHRLPLMLTRRHDTLLLHARTPPGPPLAEARIDDPAVPLLACAAVALARLGQPGHGGSAPRN